MVPQVSLGPFSHFPSGDVDAEIWQTYTIER